MEKINLKEKFTNFDEYWSPKIIAESNGQLIKIAKGSGELVWHKHKNEDEFFIVFKGQLILQLRDKTITLNPGEMYVVEKGVEHCPKSDGECHFMMIEPASTAHTGETLSDVTVPQEEQEWI